MLWVILYVEKNFGVEDKKKINSFENWWIYE